ncbi:MAG: hypothetical protein LBH14_01205 [Desulfobulbaceae bacterium]|jgi:hypothetical protein|nr:hypothetical protein [Desulfobulbaceae bacterium]
MDTDNKRAPSASSYTCNDYRAEMMLLAMRRKLQNDGMNEDEADRLRQEIAHLEKQIGMD